MGPESRIQASSIASSSNVTPGAGAAATSPNCASALARSPGLTTIVTGSYPATARATSAQAVRAASR